MTERHPGANASQRQRRASNPRIDYYPSQEALEAIATKRGPFYPLNTNSGVLDAIVEFFPTALGSVIAGIRAGGHKPFEYQLAVIGWSPAKGRICGRWYIGRTDEDGYDEDELGSRVAPWHNKEAVRVPDSEENIRWLAERQVVWLRSDENRAGGGDLLVAELTRQGCSMRSLGDCGKGRIGR